ncbi:MAG: PAS domain S-box protein [Bacteroidota bacterium]
MSENNSYLDLFTKLDFPLIELDQHFKVQRANKAAQQLLSMGAQPEQAVSIFDIDPLDLDKKRVREVLLNEEGPYTFICSIRDQFYTMKWINMDSSGSSRKKKRYVIHIYHNDPTGIERQQLELAFRAAQVGTWQHNLQNDIVTFDEQSAQHFGFDDRSVPFQKIIDRTHPEDLPGIQKMKEQTIDKGIQQQFQLEYRIREQKSTYKWISIHAEVTTLPGPEPQKRYVYGTSQDVTDRKEQELELKRIQHTYETISEIHHALSTKQGEQQLLDAVCKIAVQTGAYKMAWIGKLDKNNMIVQPVAYAGNVGNYLDNIDIDLSDPEKSKGPTGIAITEQHPDISRNIISDQRMRPWVEEAQEHGYHSSAAIPIIIDGESWGALNLYAAAPEAFNEKELQILIELVNDLAFGIRSNQLEKERLNSIAKLNESRERLRLLINTSPLGMVVYQNDQIIFANPAFVEQVDGQSGDRLDGHNFKTFLNEDAHAELKNAIQQIYSGYRKKVVFETQMSTFENNHIYARITITPYTYQDKDAVQLVVEDETERKQAEREIKRIYKGIQQSPAVVVITDTEGNIEYVNPQFEAVTGYSAEEVIGKNPKLLQAGQIPIDTNIDMWKTISSGETWSGEFINQRKNGEGYYFAATISPVENERGKIENYIAVGEDVTLSKKQERKIKQALEEKTILLKEVHHRVKNNLAVISGLLELQILNAPEVSDQLRISQQRIQSIAKVHELLYQAESFTHIDMQLYLEEISNLDMTALSEREQPIELDMDIGSVEIDITEAVPMGLIINELMTNSYKHAFEQVENPCIYVSINRNEAGMITFEYRDNGKGLGKNYSFEELGGESSLGIELIQILIDQLNGQQIRLYTKESFHLSFQFKSGNPLNS